MPPTLPRKYGSGIGGMSYTVTAPALSDATTCVSSDATTSLPKTIGDLILPLYLQPLHIPGFSASNLSHL